MWQQACDGPSLITRIISKEQVFVIGGFGRQINIFFCFSGFSSVKCDKNDDNSCISRLSVVVFVCYFSVIFWVSQLSVTRMIIVSVFLVNLLFFCYFFLYIYFS